MVKDTVCEMEIDETTAGNSLIFEGQTYFFCSEGCRAEFQRHPEDYVKSADSVCDETLGDNDDV